jgi:tetratricopeptide (TPR) repeat protein
MRDQPPDAAVLDQLTRMLSSEVFARSDRLSAFLRFIVERTLNGEGDSLKEHVLATELYGKAPDFNAAADPIVRVDARRLRDRLREYYASAPDATVTISVPKGSYTPAFRANRPSIEPSSGYTSHPRAYDSYLRGRFAERERTAASNGAAIRFFEEATTIDPGFALAWCGLADIYASSGINGDGEPAVIAPRAREAAARAVVADPQLAEAQLAVAQVRFWFDWDAPAAEAALRRALALDAGNAHIDRMLGFVWSAIGRHADAQAASQRSIDRDPLNPLNYAVASEVAFRRRDYEGAATQAERSFDLDSRWWIGYMLAAQAYEQLGARDRALEAVSKAQHLSGKNSKTISLRGYVLARVGLAREARLALEELGPDTRAGYVPPYASALIHAGLGDRDATFEWLERAYAARDIHLVLLRTDPKWDPYRDDPRFESLVARCHRTC